MISKKALLQRIRLLEVEVSEQRRIIEELAARAGVSLPPASAPHAAPRNPRSPLASESPVEALPPLAARALAEGRKIEAIKLLRESTGWGLLESKQFMDRVAAAGPGAASVSSEDSSASTNTSSAGTGTINTQGSDRPGRHNQGTSAWD